ncbi:MAG: ABC transporter permease [Clostridia bacterium]|nr:ABC transporter permease [Clostridia bacterium]
MKKTMRRSDLLKLAVAGLRRRPSRTLMMITGILIGSACIVLMLSIGYSSNRQFAAMLESNTALTRIEVSDFGAGRSRLTDSTIAIMTALPHVEAVSPVLDVPAVMRAGAYEAAATVTAIDPAVLRLHFSAGGMFAPSASMPSLVIGEDAMKYFIDSRNPPDFADWEAYQQYTPDIDWLSSVLDLQVGYADAESEVPRSGVYRVGVAGLISADQKSESGRIYMDLESIRSILQSNRDVAAYLDIPLSSYQQAVIRVDDMDNVAGVTESIRQLGFEAFSEAEYILQMQSEQDRQQTQLFAIGLVSLCVAALGIANTMYASVLESRAEIGIMKVVGMKLQLIRQMFTMQAGIVGLMGGVLGLLVSWVVVWVINTCSGDMQLFGMELAAGTKIAVPVWAAAGAVGISVGTGVLAGLFPARKATKMSALQAMRDS